MKINEDTKTIIIYIIVTVLILIGSNIFNNYKDESQLKIIKTSLQEYFENNNTHISSHDFIIDDVNIICRGNNAYIVEFDILFDDESEDLKKLGATVYKKDNVWNVKGYGKGLTTDEIKKYNFKCKV